MNMQSPGITQTLLMSLALFASAAEASDDRLLSEADFFVDIPEVTSATRMPQKLSEAPASMTVIDREVIEASGFQTIPDLMRLVPGFQTYTLNSDTPATSYHGAAGEYPNQLEVMIDGRSVYLPLLSTVRWETLGISIHDVERIEVVRGSNVPTQGSNAFLGSINIVTREPTATSGLDLTTLYGSDNTRNGHLSFADSNGLISYRISANHEQSDGNDHYSNFYTGDWFAEDGSDGKWQDEQSRNYLNLSTTWTPDLVNSLWFQAGIDRGTSRMGALDTEDAHFADRDHESAFASARYNHLYSDTGMVQLKASLNRLSLETPKANAAEVLTELGVPGPANCTASGLSASARSICTARLQAAQSLIDLNDYHLVEENGKTHTGDIELQISDKRENLAVAGGIGYRHMAAKSAVLLQNGQVHEDRSRLFANADWDFTPRWQLSSGVMYEYSSEASEAFSYRNALIFTPRQGSSLRLGYSSSERLPSLLERYGEATLYLGGDEYDHIRTPTPDLEPEEISSWELGYYQTLPGQRSYLDLRIFREELNNVVDSFLLYADEEDGRVFTSRNTASWINEGAEAQLRFELTPQVWTLLSYAYINTKHSNWRTGEDKVYEGKRFFNVSSNISPEHTASLMLNWSPDPTLDLTLSHYYMSGVRWIDSVELPGYNRTDLRVAKRWQVSRETELEAAVIMQNAFEPDYQDFYELNEFDRRTFLQFSIRHD
ncbi:TonB-dependent receptor plug domain-containing protein [Marinobacterium lutimaris]|uniref:Outer membrane receptor for ferrienterochelin and colicins n=1 Tax=Marinobacterium lutimaris TaxID=568106 RepID=A0A1H6CTP8_9GAMM|nr:TonB-dependent receptor [Marinobacterium lutimaris]SEG76332.1 Outer membrane receptor for ferrienterochelin and colicins [Marinobacterium lutimaris]